MGLTTEISWARSTFNPWIGCERISPACEHCYAESYARRTGKAHLWKGERYRTSAANWRQPLKWNAEASKTGEQWRVFCASLADVFDNAVPDEWRADLFELIRATPALTWMLLTKRVGNAARMLPADWGNGYPNVWLGATVVTQEEVDRDVPKLLETPARTRFLSCEPLLEMIDLLRVKVSEWTVEDGQGVRPHYVTVNALVGRTTLSPNHIDWVIAGGESGSKARPMHAMWARSLRDQCVRMRVPFHFKQWGEYSPGLPCTRPEDQEMRRIGKLFAGRELDGRTWDEFPEAR